MAVVGALLLLSPLIRRLIPVIRSVHEGSLRMKAGQRYMDSLTPEMCREWAARTDAILSNPGKWDIPGADLPPELKNLKIISVDIGNGEDGLCVYYKWMGGFDQTALVVTKRKDGKFEFTGEYDDEHDSIDLPGNGKPLKRLGEK